MRNEIPRIRPHKLIEATGSESYVCPQHPNGGVFKPTFSLCCSTTSLYVVYRGVL